MMALLIRAFDEMIGSGGYMVWLSNTINANVLALASTLWRIPEIFSISEFLWFPGSRAGRFVLRLLLRLWRLNIGANVAGTNSVSVRACYGDPIQLYAYGGTNYLWTPDTYLDDATSNLPTAINLPTGIHLYTVEVSGGCDEGIDTLEVQVTSPVAAFFQPNVLSGCSPLQVQFDDQSSGGRSGSTRLKVL